MDTNGAIWLDLLILKFGLDFQCTVLLLINVKN